MREDINVFPWLCKDMLGIYPTIIVLYINIDPKFKHVKQKRYTFNAKRYMVINDEVDNLLKDKFIR